MESVVQPEASVVQTGPGIRNVGNYAYGYSGQIDLDNTTQTLFSYTNGKSVFVGQFQMLFDKTQFNTGEALGYTIKFNDLIVARLELEASATTTESIQSPVNLVVPPLTQVLITGDTDGGSIVVTGLVTGRTYGEE
jgi:hypothetical protein